MSGKKLYNLMQMNGGTFPTGGFSQSWGLETYVAEGRVKDAESFREFLEVYLIACIGKCEGPIVRAAFAWEELEKLEELSNASKVTRESREAALRMGKAFFRVMEQVLPEEGMKKLRDTLGTKEISYPVAYGACCRLMDVDIDEAVAAYIYSAANTLVQSAVKLIPLGNTEAQKVLYDATEIMDRAAHLAAETPVERITNFCPGMDMAGIKHETLPVRLYMS